MFKRRWPRLTLSDQNVCRITSKQTKSNSLRARNSRLMSVLLTYLRLFDNQAFGSQLSDPLAAFYGKYDFLSIQFDCRFYICTFQYVTLVKISTKLMLFCCIYQFITIFVFTFHSEGVAGNVTTILLQIPCWIQRWNFFRRPTFIKVMDG